jgi:hypothetical protein
MHEGKSVDNSWSALGYPVTVVPIGADHHSMLAQPFLDVLGARFIDALRAETAHCEMVDA